MRALLGGRPGIVEKRMVGGRSFSVNGSLACGVTSRGLLVRVGADHVEEACRQPHVGRMTLGSKPLAAFVLVAADGLDTDVALRGWLDQGLAVAAEQQA